MPASDDQSDRLSRFEATVEALAAVVRQVAARDTLSA